MHHIQKDIILKLAHKQQARFADLKPPHLDSNVFTYHLKQLVAAKLIAKTDDNCYHLTQKGKLAGINIRLDAKAELEQAHSVIYLAMRNPKGQWLLRRRLVHPAYGKVGFMHGEPSASETIHESANKLLMLRAGLEADFKVRGSGYLTLFRGDDLESFSHFTLLYADVPEMELTSPGESGQNIWYSGDFTEPEMFPNMPKLISLIDKSDDIFFASLTDKIDG